MKKTLTALLIILIGVSYSQDLDEPTVPDTPRVVKEFKEYIAKVPTEIEKMEITIIYTKYPDSNPSTAIVFKNTIKDEMNNDLEYDGDRGDLKPQMIDEDISWLESFILKMMTKAEKTTQ